MILQNTDRRVLWLRATLIIASFLGLIASAPVWTNTRTFPLLPIFNGFPILPAPWDRYLFITMLASLGVAVRFYRPGIIIFLASSFIAYCGDQNRGQPWLYMYWVMLLLSLFPTPIAIAANRFAITTVYLWGGIQKLNFRFFEVTPQWFVAPAANWHLPPVVINLLKISVESAPFVEIAIALLLWKTKLRRAALGLTVLTHAFALLFLGPLGHNYNWVVWPWNLAMVALVFGLFANGKLFETPTSPAGNKSKLKLDNEVVLSSTVSQLRRNRPALSIVAAYAVLPILSYSGLWDSYFSFSLYSENLAVANIFVTEKFRDNLPQNLKRHAQPFTQAYDPEHQGPLTFAFTAWGYEEMHVPPISEPRNFENVYRALLPYATTPADLRMIVGPRSGPVIFREGQRTDHLQPIR